MEYHYCVLYARVLRQYLLNQAIREALPDGMGDVFYLCTEFWRNMKDGKHEKVIKPMFPGYVFIRSSLGYKELHQMVLERRKDVLDFVRELHLSEMKAAGIPLFGEESPFEDGKDGSLQDLTPDEAEFIEFMYRFGEDETETEMQPDSEKNGTVPRKRLPGRGVLRASYGYREDGRYVVMEGPLKGHEKFIKKVDAHERKAYLKMKINGRPARCGFEDKGKRFWFPDDKDAEYILADGSRLKTQDLAKSMMG